jgi:glycogen debranching enzyme
MVLGHRKKGNRLILRNVHNDGHDLFLFTPVADGQPLDYALTMTDTVLTLETAQGNVEFCFESADTLRVKGTGVALDVTCLIPAPAYSESANLATFNCRKALRRYQLETLAGKSTLRGRYRRGNQETPGLLVEPGEDGVWEFAMDEYWSTWKRPGRKPFARCQEDTAAAFERFLDSMPQAHAHLGKARRLAAYVNWATTVAPSGLLKRHALLMSKKNMTSLWSWDQCFNAMALAGGQDALAMDQMLVLVDNQDKFGSYPDAINDISIHYNFSKPPVHGWTFGCMLETMKAQPDAGTMRTMYDSLSRQVNWWMTYRRKEGSELPYYLHGNDSGWDNSTMFDQGVPLEAPDLAALLVVQMDVLGELCLKAGKPEDQPQWRERANRLFNALMKELWQGDHFAARLANEKTFVANQSLIPFLAAILGKRLPEEVRACLKKGIERHLTEWGPATEHPSSPKYESDGYWRGPVWAPSTYIAVCGMERCGYPDFAREIAKRFCALCDRSGFAENFDAVTGAPLRDPAYTWTSSAFLLMLKRL